MHEWDHRARGCACGWTQKSSLPRGEERLNHPHHVAAALCACVAEPARPDMADRYGETWVWHEFPGCEPGYHLCVDGKSISYIDREFGTKLQPITTEENP